MLDIFLKKKNKGFTLVELLLVISIISLLSSIVLTSTRGVRERALIARKIQQAGPFHRMLGVGLVGEWRFEEANLPFIDTSQNGNDFNLSFQPTIPVQKVDSFHPSFGSAVRTANDGFYSFPLPQNSSLNLGGGDVTIAVWVNSFRSQNGNIFRVGGASAWTGRTYSMMFANSNNQIRMKIGTYTSNPTEALELNKWYFVLGTYNHKNKNISIYVDAEKQVNESAGPVPGFPVFTFVPFENNFVIMANAYVYSIIDDLRVYNEAFTEAQVRKMYAEEISKKGLVLE